MFGKTPKQYDHFEKVFFVTNPIEVIKLNQFLADNPNSNISRGNRSWAGEFHEPPTTEAQTVLEKNGLIVVRYAKEKK